MGRRNIYIDNILLMAALAIGALLISCRDDESQFVSPDDRSTTGTLVLATLGSNTRADEHFGDDVFGESSAKQEEAIHSAELYFFETASDLQPSFYHVSLKDLGAITRAEVTLKLPMTKIDKFKQRNGSDEKKAYVYALVNLPYGTVLPDDENATLADLKEVRVENPGFTSAGTPADFVMRGGQDVSLVGEDRDAKITGWIPLERLAAKVRMFCNIHPRVYLDKDGKTIYRLVDENGEYKETEGEWKARAAEIAHEVWEARPEVSQGENAGKNNTFLYFFNYATNANINGTCGGFVGEGENREFVRPEWVTYDDIDRTPEKESMRRTMKKGVGVADYTESAGGKIVNRDNYPYTHEVPYYSYPNAWNSNSLEEEHATNVMLRLQWECVYDKEYDEGIYQEGQTSNDPVNRRFEYFYYQIPVNRLPLKDQQTGNDCINSNTYYRILIDIAMLGAKDLGTPLPIDASWEAIPWGYAAVDVNIKERRYLVVNQTNWTMNNVHTIQIPFSTSHNTEVLQCYVTYFRYNDSWGVDRFSQTRSGNDWDNNEEFEKWLAAADTISKRYTEGPNKETIGREGERLLTGITFDGKSGDVLYYKKDYFYDPYYYELRTKLSPQQGQDGYVYYVGKEHPKTFNEDLIKYNNGKYKDTNGDEQDMQPAEKEAWRLFNQKYDNMGQVYKYSINEELGVIDFLHPLVQWKEVRSNGETGKLLYYVPETNPHTNNTTLWDEFSRCEIVIRIRHTDWTKDDLYEETIYITQYPAIYVEESHNYGFSGVWTSNQTTQLGFNQYVIVNGNNNAANGGTTAWYEANKDQVENFYGSNNNPNMYVIHTTQFSEDNYYRYTLGDPRSLYVDNTLTSANNSTSLPMTANRYDRWAENNGTYLITNVNHSVGPVWWLERTLTGGVMVDYNYVESWYKDKPGNTGTFDAFGRPNNNYKNNKNNLYYYYPTDETPAGVSGTKVDFVAPVFRIASSFGKVTATTNKVDARRRCATYQEAGRPAGRWRLPTKSEIEYVAWLAADKQIPILFGNAAKGVTDRSGRYWSATGKVKVDVDATTNKVVDITDQNAVHSPRCVYDEWYWNKIDAENENVIYPLSTTFVWGDWPKDNPQTN